MVRFGGARRDYNGGSGIETQLRDLIPAIDDLGMQRKRLTTQVKNLLMQMTVPKNSPEGQAIINESGGDHVSEVWEDGEMTSTKGGNLYGLRNVHMSVMGGGLNFITVAEEGKHESRIVKPEYDRVIHDVLFKIWLLDVSK